MDRDCILGFDFWAFGHKFEIFGLWAKIWVFGLKFCYPISYQLKFRKTNEKSLKTLSFNDKDKIKGKVNSTRFDFLV